MWPHTVAILIGGRSTRMQTPKQNVTLPSGQTMLEKMLEFARATATSTVVVGGEVKGIHSILDHRDTQGPVAGIEALLDRGSDEQYLVVGCDMPFIQSEDVQPLFDCAGNALFESDGQFIPLPLRVTAQELNQCTAYLDSGKRSIRGFIESIPHNSIPIESDVAATFKSINTPKELSEFYPQT